MLHKWLCAFAFLGKLPLRILSVLLKGVRLVAPVAVLMDSYIITPFAAVVA